MMEFALILPVFVFGVMGGMEYAWEAVCRQKIQRLAATSADNTARIRGAIDETDIHEIMAAVRLNGADLDFQHRGRVIISSIQRNKAGNGDWVRWQRCFGEKKATSKFGGEGHGANDDTMHGLHGDAAMRPPPGIALVVAEVYYDHQPLVTDRYFGRRTLSYETAFIVRDRNDLSLGNVTGLSNDEKLTCA